MSEYKISACYFPKVSEVDLTYERISDSEQCSLTLSCTPEQGKELVRVIDPCVYFNASLDSSDHVSKSELRAWCEDEINLPAFTNESILTRILEKFCAGER